MPLLDYRFAFKIVEKRKKNREKKKVPCSHIQHSSTEGEKKKKEALHILVLSEFICVSLRKTSPE